MLMSPTLVVAFLAAAGGVASSSAPFYDTQTWPNRTGIVHLFEWKWLDVAKECEQFLAPKGYAAVQVSPPTENLVIRKENGARTWYERYQVMSYRLVTRSGNEQQFAEMTRRCNKVGVRIYVDLVINHMTADADNAIGTGGISADANALYYPGVPFSTEHFNKPQCAISDYDDVVQVRNCELVALHDLNQTHPYVREKIVELMDHLIDLGVAGFRVDAAKHMWPDAVKAMMEATKTLNVEHGFEPESKAFVYQEIIDFGGGKIKYDEYTGIGRIIDFRSSREISRVFGGSDQLRWLRNWGPGWNLVYGPASVVFVDNHDNQRDGHGEGAILTYKRSRLYKMAVAFLLAYPHGFPRVMSSFAFDDFDMGPPMTPDEEIISPEFDAEGACTNGYICEHRWRQIYSMIGFRNVAHEAPVSNWWDNGGNQIAFGRGDKAFIAFNREDRTLHEVLQTSLPPGTYCDVVSGAVDIYRQRCTGKEVTVARDSKAAIYLGPEENDGFLAIHVGAMISK